MNTASALRGLRRAFAAMALIAAVLLALHVRQEAAEREAALAAQLAVAAEAAAAGVTQFLRRTEDLLNSLAARPAVAALGQGGCDPVFETFSVQNPDYANLLLVDGGGWIRCSARRLGAGPVRLGPLYILERAREERRFIVGRPEIGFISGRWVFPVVVPLADAAGRFRGIVGVSVDLERLGVLGGLSAGTGEAAPLLADAEGLILAAGAGAAQKTGMHLDPAAVAALTAVEARGWRRIARADGGRFLLVRAPVAGSAWFAVAQADTAPLDAALWRDGLRLGGLLTLAALCALWLLRRLERAAAGAGAAVATAAHDRTRSALDAETHRVHAGEEELGAVLDAVDEVVFALSADGAALLYLSPGAERLYGTSVRHFAADPSLRHAAVPAEDRPRLAELEAQVARDGRGDIEYRIRRGDGALRWLRERRRLLRDAAGRPLRQVGVLADVTTLRELVDSLKASEARLQQVLEATSEGVWDYDIEAGETYFSPHFAELLGYADAATLKANFNFTDALHPEDRPHAMAAQERTLRVGAGFDEIYRLRRKDGDYRWFHGRGIAVRDGEGRVARFVGAIADVTVQKAAEAQLRKLSAAVEQSPVSIIITDTGGNIEYVNPHFCRTSGYSFDEVRGRNPRFLKSGETSDEEYRRLWHSITQGEAWSGELHNRRKNGEMFWEFVRIIPLVSEKGETTHFMAIKEDITLRKELTAREQLHQEQMLHHARLAAMGEMAAALAHELNQPLAAIANFSGVVEHQIAAPQTDLAQVREVVRAIAGQALRAGDIVWRVREFSRKQEARRAPTDLNGLVGDVVRLADIAARSREVAYEYDLAPGLPLVAADRVQIEQVLLNLIRNGVEAMEDVPPERKRLLLASRLAEGGGAVQMTVRDQGSGLPDRIAVDLFTPFFTTKPEGMGMGLSISRGIVEAHGGRLWAASNEDGGASFHFTLPLRGEEKA